MAWLIPQSGSGNIDTVNNSVYIGRPVMLGARVLVNGSNQEVRVFGTIASTNEGIWFNSTGGANNRVLIAEGGVVQSLGGLSNIAVDIFGTTGTVINHGFIGSEGYGIYLIGFTSAGESRIINTGTIEAENRGVGRSGDQVETIVLINSGTISGGQFAYGVNFGSPNNTDLITNTGTMVGDIHLHGGADIYTGTRGRLDGDIFAGAGADRLLGGIDADIFDGGADADELDGGLGADLMKGGTGADSYFVDNRGDVVDETGGDGIDRVNASVTFSLSDAAHAKGTVEHLTLTGAGNINGTGNAEANQITGNAGRNTLKGDAGLDRLTGGAGQDTLFGGANADAFVFALGHSGIRTATADRISDWAVEDSIDTAFAGSRANYLELATTATTIEAAASFAETKASASITHVFLYNASRDTGFLVSDLDRNFVFETGIVLLGRGAAGEFDRADLI